ncbi:hypothetical protein [Mesorhizobium sp. BH1-1-4]|uniref:hypothetical protein n=1 Tax=Mesorhizobium sp. BH1-1-4 TaxID=2876662 RepID=UPI001CD0AB1D|nr:hypothetical protein [Mesorhizobium sp. BH1-1-4]MBZ9997604.1 hypothetical protein [Mesorhizobium sp. BH1-1-4]
MRNDFLFLFQRFEHHRKDGAEADRADRPHKPLQSVAACPFPTLAVALRLPLKWTIFYYPAKIFRLYSKAAMTMIRTLAFATGRHAARGARHARMQAPR